MIGLFGSIKMIKDCNESDFELFDVLMYDLVFLAKGAAFLVFLTLEHKNTGF